MNKKMVKYLTGKILLVEAILLVFPLIVSFIYKEDLTHKLSFMISMVFIFIVSLLLSYKEPEDKSMRPVDGFIVVSLSWILLSFFGAFPFVISGEIPSLMSAFFETSSGFTTTGSTILIDVEAMNHSHIFWRSFTHLIGGMGVLVFALAILPSAKSENNLGSTFVMKAEMPGPLFGKLVSKMKDTARILYIIYLIMTLVLVILLVMTGMPFFDSLIHAFGTAGTGGFSLKGASVGYYNNPAAEIIIGIGMLAFGVNFNLYYLILIGQGMSLFENDELKLYLKLALVSTLLIIIDLCFKYNVEVKDVALDAFFSVSSVMTTTGFSTADFNEWPTFSKTILNILMFVGACAGSTAGGLKVSRVGVLLKSIKAEIHRLIHPNSIKSIRFDGKVLDDNSIRGILNYFAIYVLIFIISVLIVSSETNDFTTAFSAVSATFNNIGPGFEGVGPMSNFSQFSEPMQLYFSFIMIAGRLEIYPMLLLFHGIFVRDKI